MSALRGESGSSFEDLRAEIRRYAIRSDAESPPFQQAHGLRWPGGGQEGD